MLFQFSDIISAVATASLVAIAGGLWRLSIKLNRIEVIVEGFVNRVDNKLDDHEDRIRDLEHTN